MEASKKRSELEERLRALQEEKVSLLSEIEALKAIQELEATIASLEPEVVKLRDEKKALEEKVAPSPPTPATVILAETSETSAPAPVPAEASTSAEAPVQAEEQASTVEEETCEPCTEEKTNEETTSCQ